MAEDQELNIYHLSRAWFDFCFANPELIVPNHTAVYFFAIEHCNRLGWKQKFGLPTSMVKEAVGIKSYKTYSNTLNDLVSWGFIKMIEKSKNQYSSNIIALVKNVKAHTKALDKALLKHVSKQVQSTSESISESIDSIDKQVYNIQSNKVQVNKVQYPSAEIELIIENLNELTGSSYRTDSKNTKKIIAARLAENYTVEDFKKVIAGRYQAWGQDPKMKDYLRPETLFGPKFENYLNNANKILNDTVITNQTINSTGGKQSNYNSNKADVATLVKNARQMLGGNKGDNG